MAGPQTRGDGRLDRLLAQARAALLVERLWPLLVLFAAIAAVFVAVSWLGLWLVAPPWLHGAGFAGFAAALLWAAGRAARLRWPGRAEALARLDRDSGLRHQPFATGEDGLANPAADVTTRALWELHRRRAAEAASRTRVRPPAPRLVDHDRYALRAGALLVLVAAGFVAGPDKEGRLAAAFEWRGDETGANATRIDAWIDPPAYTGKPPLVLVGPNAVAAADGAPVSAPVGSVVVVRAAGAGRVAATGDGGLKPPPAKTAPSQPPRSGVATAVADTRLVLGGDGTITITENGATLRTIPLKAIPDLPPRVALLGVPKAGYRGTLALAYALSDDYGVVGADARFERPVIDGKPVTGRSLVEPPKGTLTLPSTPGGIGNGKTTLDLSDHPWAGAHVTMTLTARDEAGNTGESKPVDLVLPARPFTVPLARALVEQRRNLVLDPDHRERVAAALDALDFAPEVFDVPLGVHLGLHAAELRLKAATTDPQLLEVADLLWAMALRIENGDLTQAEQELRAAQKELRDAMARGAPPDEIKRLTENLRKRMDTFLSEMAQRDQRNGDQRQAQDQNSRTMTQKDLQSMLDRMEQAARNGDMQEAQRLLDQLNGIMNNMKTAKSGRQQSQAAREMNRAMGDLDRMMRDQSDVRDKTFQQGNRDDGDPQDGGDQEAGPGPQGQDQGSEQDGQDGQSGRGQKPGPGLGELKQRQGGLSQRLHTLQKRMRDLGMRDEQGLADAQDAMKQAEGALGKGQDGVGEAVGAQGRALEAMQQAIKGLGKQMGGEGSGQPGQGQAAGDDDPSDQDGTDPLGRSREGGIGGAAESGPYRADGGLAARAARVMEELRRRLADPTRTPEEQDYLERLLKRY